MGPPKREPSVPKRQLEDYVKPLLEWVKLRFPSQLSPIVSPEDVVQEALLRAREHHHIWMSLDPLQRWAWLKTTSQRILWRASEKLRLEPRAGAAELSELDLLASVLDTSVPDNVEERKRSVREAIENLPPAQQDATRRFYFERRSVSATSSVLGRTLGAVKKLLCDARKNLRRMLTQQAGSKGNGEQRE